MNSPRIPSEDDWLKRAGMARRDVPPDVDLSALLRAVRSEPLPAQRNWLTDFVTVFASPRIAGACGATAAVLATAAGWLAYDLWQALPWAAQWSAATGGVS